jgi:hypothetical protein
MKSWKKMTMTMALHLLKNTTQLNHQEILLPMDGQRWSISHYIFPHISGATGAMQMLLKT